MKYQQQVNLSGAWINKNNLKNGQRAKIVSETKPIPSQFQDDKGNVKNQDVCKVQFEGEKESVNVPLNRATITGLISAFGDDSINWQSKYLTVELEKMRIAGKAVTALYLVPEGYQKVDDASGYVVISKLGVPTNTEFSPNLDNVNADIAGEDLPF